MMQETDFTLCKYLVIESDNCTSQ